MREFHHSQEIATLGLSLFIWGMGEASTKAISVSKQLTFVLCRGWPASAKPIIRGKSQGMQLLSEQLITSAAIWSKDCLFVLICTFLYLDVPMRLCEKYSDVTRWTISQRIFWQRLS